jgi:hypothetical protein
VGEKQNQPFQISFNASLKVDFQRSRVTSNAGLILVRELDERLGLGDLIGQHLTDSQLGKKTPNRLFRRPLGAQNENRAGKVQGEAVWDILAAIRQLKMETHMKHDRQPQSNESRQS